MHIPLCTCQPLLDLLHPDDGTDKLSRNVHLQPRRTPRKHPEELTQFDHGGSLKSQIFLHYISDYKILKRYSAPYNEPGKEHIHEKKRKCMKRQWIQFGIWVPTFRSTHYLHLQDWRTEELSANKTADGVKDCTVNNVFHPHISIDSNPRYDPSCKRR